MHIVGLFPVPFQKVVGVSQVRSVLKDQPPPILLGEDPTIVAAHRMSKSNAAPDGIGSFRSVGHGLTHQIAQATGERLHAGTVSDQDVIGRDFGLEAVRAGCC